MATINPSRRQVLKGSAAAMAVGAIGSLSGLYSRQALAATSPMSNLPEQRRTDLHADRPRASPSGTARGCAGRCKSPYQFGGDSDFS